MKKIVFISLFALCFPRITFAVYNLPNIDSGCPENCRIIPWSAGSDLWSSGTLPRYTSIPCTVGLSQGDGTTNNANAIQACINAAAPNTAVTLPSGIYYVDGAISLKDNIVLRGAGAGSPWLPGASVGTTTLKFGTGGYIALSTTYSRGIEVAITGGYTKGSTVLNVNSGHGIAAGDHIIVTEHADTEIGVTNTGTGSACTWCGMNDGVHLMAQIIPVQSVTATTITLRRPLYYTFKSNLSPSLYKLNFGRKYAGIEDIKLNGWSNSRGNPHIKMAGAAYCWVKNVETYNTPNVGKAFPVYLAWAYGNEIRDSYFHYGQGNGGDRNYGIGLLFVTSDNKIENNILRENRHSIVQEGGGSGNVFLYNYMDDNYTDDPTYIGSSRINHGAHPYMMLLEGNIISRIEADFVWGSSSHGTFFRNWLWGDETGNFPGFGTTNPIWPYVAFYLSDNQKYYSLVGNVLGKTGLHANWANAGLLNTGTQRRENPTVYDLGLTVDLTPFTLLHGNYDFKTNGVAHWQGGDDHVLKNSMYYSTTPAFWCTEVPFPPIGPDVQNITNIIPSKRRYDGSLCTTSTTKNPKFPFNILIQ